jgi:hypothetical protein
MMEAEIILVCPNDCMLFRGVHKYLKKCLKCNDSRYKQKCDEIESTKDANVGGASFIGNYATQVNLWE